MKHHLALGAVAAMGLACGGTGADPDQPDAASAVDATAADAAPAGPCDVDLALADPDPHAAARALGICDPSAGAAYVRADGAAAASTPQNGILVGFGTANSPREGDRLLALSDGRARDADDVDACPGLSCDGVGAGTAPAGFPQASGACATPAGIYDDVALELELHAPADAVGFSLDFDYYTFEYPEYVCTAYNDQFVVLVAPAPAGSINGNIAFDATFTPISVNVTMRVCDGCELGTTEFAGTGFGLWNDAGATGWMRTTAPVVPDSDIQVRLAIWDGGDSTFDSTVLIDNFRWITSGTVTVATTPL